MGCSLGVLSSNCNPCPPELAIPTEHNLIHILHILPLRRQCDNGTFSFDGHHHTALLQKMEVLGGLAHLSSGADFCGGQCGREASGKGTNAVVVMLARGSSDGCAGLLAILSV